MKINDPLVQIYQHFLEIWRSKRKRRWRDRLSRVQNEATSNQSLDTYGILYPDRQFTKTRKALFSKHKRLCRVSKRNSREFHHHCGYWKSTAEICVAIICDLWVDDTFLLLKPLNKRKGVYLIVISLIFNERNQLFSTQLAKYPRVLYVKPSNNVKAPFTRQKSFGTARMKIVRVPKKIGSARIDLVV